MINKKFIKIINEEVSKFDFLGNEEYLKEQEVVNVLLNEEFQKQFICDSLLNKNKIKTNVLESRINGNWENDNDDASKLILEYFLKIEYKYDQEKEPINFDLNFYGDNISISKVDDYDKGSYDVAPSGKAWFNNFNWNDIDVDLNTTEGDEIKFLAFERAPQKIKMLFVREYVESYVINYTGLDIETPETNVDIKNTPYC